MRSTGDAVSAATRSGEFDAGGLLALRAVVADRRGLAKLVPVDRGADG
jgi:hypothetical protein